MASFRTTVWDPSLIVGQIFALQSIFYLSECVLMILCSFVSTYNPAVEHLFSLQTIRPMTMVQLISSVVVAFSLSHIVQRAKQCLDFATTLHIIHVVVVVLYNSSFPTSFTWWLLQIISCVICSVLGEYLCMQKESMEIPLSTAPLQRTQSSEA
uniref:Protein SYS1 homolog n=1 Tax=Panagrolaimus sp. JU765 TaxID=591449 RepID=A0AC34QQZ7_9BILA